MGMSPVPTGTRISQEFGAFPGGYNPAGGHTGRDYATPVGTPIVAPEDAIVRWAADGSALPGGPNDWAVRWYFDKAYPGGLIVLEVPKWGAMFAVAHCSGFDVKLGQHVKKGQIVGRTGNTGTATTGPHAHVEVIPTSYAWGNGTYGRVHPGPYLTEAYRPAGGQVTVPKVTKNRVLDGIDVSAYQPADIVRRVASGFVIVKTTEGAGWESDRWKAQLSDARSRGKEVGVYHYAHPGLNSSDAEARFFVNTVKKAGMDSPGLVYVLDWEEAAFYRYTDWARDFMAEVDRLTGRTCALYANTAGLTGGVWSAKDRARPVWRAYPVLSGTGYATSFALPGLPAGWANLVMDQYSFHGRLPGYAADLDLNVYYGGLLPWGATGSTTDLDLLEEIMATPAQRQALAKDLATAVLTYKNPRVVGKNGPDVYGLLVKAAGVMDEKVERKGHDVSGHDTLRAVVAYNASDAGQDRREHAETQAILAKLVDALEPVLEHLFPTPTNNEPAAAPEKTEG